ncbi:MAG TPA: hypothetical protein VIV63_12190 [Steroidobacteraceae bacterium]
MIRRTSKYLVMAAVISFASYANAGTAVVTPALAACSKALIETIAKTEPLPAYKVKAPSAFVSELLDPNAFTVIARHSKTNELLAKASCKATSAGEIVSFRSIPLKS